MTKIIVPINRAYGGPIFDANPTNTPWSPPRRQRGRPRADVKADRIAELHQQGESWPSIAEVVSQEFGSTSWDACRNLYKSRKHNLEKVHRKSLVPVFLQLIESMQPRILRVPRHPGRPRKDSVRFEARALRTNGATWGQVAIQLNAKYKQELSPTAYARLCGRIEKVVPWRKLDLNFIRGLKSS